ncbi:YSIRK-type signal peptide-containing protein [Abyssicoccus albus]|uniref:Secreted protein n=1 Tax=Abyssicoccus albus TaxID=1817405 RepID=A0A3N5CET5_9BACL|nr:YSIRK-type signal peptide-containing protein [Abyssicoccus albus]RPF57625.1 secreted protein [Abyssicoccus albus]
MGNNNEYKKKQRFSIRKYNFGIGSILLGSFILLSNPNVMHAAENNITMNENAQETIMIESLTTSTEFQTSINSSINLLLQSSNSNNEIKVTNLPSGLSFDGTNQVITGEFTTIGTYTINVTAVDNVTSEEKNYQFTFNVSTIETSTEVATTEEATTEEATTEEATTEEATTEEATTEEATTEEATTEEATTEEATTEEATTEEATTEEATTEEKKQQQKKQQQKKQQQKKQQQKKQQQKKQQQKTRLQKKQQQKTRQQKKRQQKKRQQKTRQQKKQQKKLSQLNQL